MPVRLPVACPGVRAVFLTLAPWAIDNGLITLTMKLKRTMIERSFAEEIGQLCAGHAMNKVLAPLE